MPKASTGKQLGVYKVTLNEGVKRPAFEKFMQTDVLKNTITFRDGHSSQDELYLKKIGGKDDTSYVWIIKRIPSIMGTFPDGDADAVFKAVKAKVEEFGLITPL